MPGDTPGERTMVREIDDFRHRPPRHPSEVEHGSSDDGSGPPVPVTGNDTPPPLTRRRIADCIAEDRVKIRLAYPPLKGPFMTLVIVLLILALVIGGVGLFVGALKWLLIIALVLLVVSAFTGYRNRGSGSAV
jgi:hypothetical protein